VAAMEKYLGTVTIDEMPDDIFCQRNTAKITERNRSIIIKGLAQMLISPLFYPLFLVTLSYFPNFIWNLILFFLLMLLPLFSSSPCSWFKFARFGILDFLKIQLEIK
jgi:hypothetical protein